MEQRNDVVVHAMDRAPQNTDNNNLKYKTGDFWIDQSDSNKIYQCKYLGYWVEVQPAKIPVLINVSDFANGVDENTTHIQFKFSIMVSNPTNTIGFRMQNGTWEQAPVSFNGSIMTVNLPTTGANILVQGQTYEFDLSTLVSALGTPLASGDHTQTMTIPTVGPVLWVEINGVKWATRNVDAFGTFAATPESAGMAYQWNRPTAWNMVDSQIPTWNSTDNEGNVWESQKNPCPTDYRLPTAGDFNTLLDTNYVSNIWTTINSVNGRLFTDLTNNNSIFIPAAGFRNYQTVGLLRDVNVLCIVWTNTLSAGGTQIMTMRGDSTGVTVQQAAKTCGFPIRCVKINP